MTTTIESMVNTTASDLKAVLIAVELRCQEMRWRLANYAAVQAVPDLEPEIGNLMVEVGGVARLYGGTSCLIGLQGTAPDVTKQTDTTEHPKTHEATALKQDLSAKEAAVTTYNVVQFYGDTEIVEAKIGCGEYATFEAAKEAAIGYLQDIMDECEMVIDELRDVETPEQYFGTDAATAAPSDIEGNVQIICPDHYQPDPQVQAKPLEWFVGKLVKLRFPIPGRPTNAERMWVAVNSLRGEELVGTLTNEPLFADQSYGDEIVFRREEVLVVNEGGVATRHN
jgi:hypothetical protein